MMQAIWIYHNKECDNKRILRNIQELNLFCKQKEKSVKQ